jgi:hypothetical protein
MSPSFFEWWFSPWNNVDKSWDILRSNGDILAQRDGYRMWCAKADVTPSLPVLYDDLWTEVMTDDPDLLLNSARLFIGIIAACEHNQVILHSLTPDARRWCVSVAATQPLLFLCKATYLESDSIEIHGLVEFAARLNCGFPGLWSRLRLLLPALLANRVSKLLESGLDITRYSSSSKTRSKRCWRLCVIQYEMNVENAPNWKNYE